MFLNQSSTTNVLPKIQTKNEAKMSKLRQASFIVEQGEMAEPKIVPKILLLSQKKEGEFKGLIMPAQNNLDIEQREQTN